MNERIQAIEDANKLLWEARIRAVNNLVGHALLCHAQDHLAEELKQMIADDQREAKVTAYGLFFGKGSTFARNRGQQ